ncbi:MAG: hypothetical protein ACKOEO_12120 [Planctomycetaceae bacterium]
MSWITETPWPGMLLLLGLAAVCWLVAVRNRGLIAVGSVLLAGLLYVVEGAIVTPAELLDTQLEALRQGFIADSEEQVFALISPAAPELRELAKQGLQMVQVSPLLHLQDVQVTPSSDGQTAEVLLRGNGPLTVRQNDMLVRVSTRWKTSWRQEDGHWKLFRVQRLNPITGEEMAVLSAQ